MSRRFVGSRPSSPCRYAIGFNRPAVQTFQPSVRHIDGDMAVCLMLFDVGCRFRI